MINSWGHPFPLRQRQRSPAGQQRYPPPIHHFPLALSHLINHPTQLHPLALLCVLSPVPPLCPFSAVPPFPSTQRCSGRTQVPSPLSFYLLPARSDNLTFIYTARDPAPLLALRARPPRGSSYVSSGPCFSPGSKSRRARRGWVKHLGSGGVWGVFLSPWSSFSPGQGLCRSAGKLSSSSCVRRGGTQREEEDGCADGRARTCC